MAEDRRNDSTARYHTERTFGCRQTEVRGQRSEVRRGRQKEKRMSRFTQLSTTTSILSLSGFAPLREIAARESRPEFFTPRRQGAKETYESKQRISFGDLSGFAPLRETSVAQGREEFFTPRRKGARKRYGSRYRISFPNLSGFAPLRETSVTQGRPEFFTLRRQGAKETYESKQRISVPNLSVLAPLRETSVTQGRPASARGYSEKVREQGGSVREAK
jgi:hypothetical protein